MKSTLDDLWSDIKDMRKETDKIRSRNDILLEKIRDVRGKGIGVPCMRLNANHRL